MKLISESVEAFSSACFIAAGILFIMSFAYVCYSPKHRLSVPLFLIYSLEIATQIIVLCYIFLKLDDLLEKDGS